MIYMIYDGVSVSFCMFFCPVFFVSETIRCRFWASRGIRCQTANEAELPRKHCSAPGEVIHLASDNRRFRRSFLQKLWTIVVQTKKTEKKKKEIEKLVRKTAWQLHTGVDIRHLARDDGQAPRPCQVSQHVSHLLIVIHLYVVFLDCNIDDINSQIWDALMISYEI